MSSMLLGSALHRIESTSKMSPLAVFKVSGNELNVVFANTVLTQRRIEANDISLIGVYHKLNYDQAMKQLSKVVNA